jgi:hypothetical protein
VIASVTDATKTPFYSVFVVWWGVPAIGSANP